MGTDYKNSIAQKKVTFATETVVSTIPGDNYYKGMIFVAESDMATYLTDTDLGHYPMTVNSTTYGDKTLGLLKTWLAGFYKGNSVSEIILVVFQDEALAVWDPAGLTDMYNSYKSFAYFKFVITSKYETDANTLLATLIGAEGKDKKLSQLWIGQSDITDATTLATTITTASNSAYMVYHYDTTINGALSQLGISLAKVNSTGTPVGNSLDYYASNNITASGTGGTNLDLTEFGPLETAKIGYFTLLGNGTSYTALQGGFMLNGDISAANWIRDYIEFCCEIKTTELITSLNAFRNNDTYQQILLILTFYLNQFSTLGRLQNVLITAPIFSELPLVPPNAGSNITIPDAWSAEYVDNVRSVNVYGTLYITL